MTWIPSAILIVLLLSIVGLLVMLILHLRKVEDGQDVHRLLLTALQKPLKDPLSMPAASAIQEQPAMAPQAALAFYQKVAALPEWPVLAHRAQTDARMALIRARMLAEDGKAQSALLQTGIALYASQLAIMPEAEIQAALNRLKQADAATTMDNITFAEELEAMRGRPAKY